MARFSNTMSLGFPPFTKAVKWLILANSAIFLLVLLLGATNLVSEGFVHDFFGLRPDLVIHGAVGLPIPFVWQVVTYSFIHAGLFHLLGNMLGLWMFGWQFESDWGTKKFLEFYFFCVVGAALVTIAISYTGVLGVHPSVATVGASGGIFGLLTAFAILYGEREFMLFPFPFTLKAKYLAAIWIFMSLVGALQGAHSRGQSVAYMCHLGGVFFGWFYVKFMPKRGLAGGFSERYFGLRNGYYRWKRRRAAKKFQVYMKKHDRNVYFDEYGNYRPPDDKGNGEHKGPWVN